ncbi:MAG: hypothetical protein HUU54_15125 [Ignavibacteriaceae bacterium]|nr:hypothetical protein [Ignavibacteriaceae bacterium]
MNTKEKVITGTVITLISGVLITLGVIAGMREQEKLITGLRISGNQLLDKTDYIEFTGFTTPESFNRLKLADIKKRFDEHSYIMNTAVKRNADNSVSVEITEKMIVAQTIRDRALHLITENLELLKLIQGTLKADYPVISNLPDTLYTGADSLKYNSELKLGVRIIQGMLYAAPDAVRLAEVDMRRGNEIIMHMENVPAFIKLGRGNFPLKIAALSQLLKNVKLKMKLDNALYVDVRYAKRIYIGNYEESRLAI